MLDYREIKGLITMVMAGIGYVFLYLPLNYLYKKLRPSPRKIVRTALIVTGIAGFSFFLFQFVVATSIQLQVNRQLGFNYATPDTKDGEAFIITRVDPNMAMYRAGLKVYDTVRLSAVADLYKMLMNNQGSEAVIPIRRGGKDIEVTVQVPEMIIKYRDICVFY